MSQFTTKVCTGVCKRRLVVSADNFYKKPDALDGFRNECKECYKAKRRKPRPSLQ